MLADRTASLYWDWSDSGIRSQTDLSEMRCILGNGDGSGCWVSPFSGVNRTSRMARGPAFIAPQACLRKVSSSKLTHIKFMARVQFQGGTSGWFQVVNTYICWSMQSSRSYTSQSQSVTVTWGCIKSSRELWFTYVPSFWSTRLLFYPQGTRIDGNSLMSKCDNLSPPLHPSMLIPQRF